MKKEEEYVNRVVELINKKMVVSQSQETLRGYVSFYAPGCIHKGESAESLAEWIVKDLKSVQK